MSSCIAVASRRQLMLVSLLLLLLLIPSGNVDGAAVPRVVLTKTDRKSFVSTCKGPRGDWNGSPYTIRSRSEDASLVGRMRSGGFNFVTLGGMYTSTTSASSNWVWMTSGGGAGEAFYQGYAKNLGSARPISGKYSNWGKISAGIAYKMEFPANMASNQFFTYVGNVVGVTGKKGSYGFSVNGWMNVPSSIIEAEDGMSISDVTGLPPDLKIDQQVTYNILACLVIQELGGGTTVPPTTTKKPTTTTKKPTTSTKKPTTSTKKPTTTTKKPATTTTTTTTTTTKAPTDTSSSSDFSSEPPTELPTSGLLGVYYEPGTFRAGVLAGVMVAAAAFAAIVCIVVICCLEKSAFEFEEFK